VSELTEQQREWEHIGENAPRWRDILKLCDEVEELENRLNAPLGLDEWVVATRRMLDEVYPASVFTGVSGDAGPRAIVVIRKALADVDAILGEVRG